VDEKKEKKHITIAVLQQTKDALDSVKHPGQTYDGMIQELIDLWKKEHGVAESVSATQE